MVIGMNRDELEGKGLFKGRKAKSDRRQQIEQQIEAWESLIEKLEEIKPQPNPK